MNILPFYLEYPDTFWSFKHTLKFIAKNAVNANLGLLDLYRDHYWELYFWTPRYRPRLVPLAISYSVYGYHFR